jgi:hypothetical protein
MTISLVVPSTTCSPGQRLKPASLVQHEIVADVRVGSKLRHSAMLAQCPLYPPTADIKRSGTMPPRDSNNDEDEDEEDEGDEDRQDDPAVVTEPEPDE